LRPFFAINQPHILNVTLIADNRATVLQIHHAVPENVAIPPQTTSQTAVATPLASRPRGDDNSGKGEKRR